MPDNPSRKTNLIQYVLLAGLALLLLFTDLGGSLMSGLQQLMLKTGLKNAPTADTKNRPVPPSAQTYPYDLTLTGLDGKTTALSELKGKVVFLNQWASWCPPCRAEMPAIEKLYQSVDKNKIAFVMLSLDEDADKARTYMAGHDFTFPAYVPGSPIPDAFSSPAIPTTFILKPDGQIAQRIEGMANYDTDAFRDYLNSLASGSQ